MRKNDFANWIFKAGVPLTQVENEKELRDEIAGYDTAEIERKRVCSVGKSRRREIATK